MQPWTRRPRRVARRWPLHPGVAATLLASVLAWAVLAWPNFKYADDDFILFTYARGHGLGIDLLALNVFAHFAPLNHVLYWVELKLSPLDVGVGFAIATAGVIVMLAAFAWLLQELQVSRRRQALAVAFLGLSITILAVGTWWGTAVHVPLSLAALLSVLACHVRALRLHSARWHVASLLVLLVGLLLQERAGFALGIAIALDMLVVWRGVSLGTALKRLWLAKWAFLAMAALVIPWYLFAYTHYYTRAPAPRGIDVILFFPFSFARYFLPALLGFYPDSTGVPVWLMTVLAVAALAGSVALVVADRTNIKPIVFFLLVYGIYYGLVAVGRLGIYSMDIEARDLQYAAYVVPFFAVALASVRFPGLARPKRGYAGALAIFVLIGCLLITDAVLARPGGLLKSSQSAHRFLTRLVASRSDWGAPTVGVVPLRVPTNVAATFVEPYGREETLLNLIEPKVRVGEIGPGGHWGLIDETGTLRSAVLLPEIALDGAEFRRRARLSGKITSAPDVAGGNSGCFISSGLGAGLVLDLPREVTGEPLMVEMRTRTSAATALRFGTAAPGVMNVNALVNRLPPGSGHVVANLDGTEVNFISLGEMTLGTRVCIDSMAIVRPLVTSDSAATCNEVDRHGRVGAITPCPAAALGSVSNQQARAVVVEVEADLGQALLLHRGS